MATDTKLIQSFNIPNECPQSKFRGRLIFSLKGLKNRFHLIVLDYGKHRMVHLRPCMTPKSGLAVETSLAFNIFPFGISALSELCQDITNFFNVRLILRYVQCFHLFFLLS